MTELEKEIRKVFELEGDETMEKTNKSVFETLSGIDVSSFIEQKNGMNYISWTHSWAHVKTLYPEATYDIIRREDGLPYFLSDEGAMVYTTVTIEGITHMMWLFAMDRSNKSLKKESYKYSTKNGEKTVEALTMFDVNKTLMRCLVKNLAMFGFGINVYAGEDLPLDFTEKTPEELEVMKVNRAKTFKLTFGKYKDKTLDELFITDPSYINYLKEKGKDDIKEIIFILEKSKPENKLATKQQIEDIRKAVEHKKISNASLKAKLMTDYKAEKVSDLSQTQADKLLDDIK